MVEMKSDYLKDGLALIGGFSLVVLTLVLVVKFFWAGSEGGDNPKIDKSIISPDKQYVAILYTFSGGGAAGWCSRDIAIMPAAKTLNTINKEERHLYEVYSGKCISSPEINWESRNELKVKLLNFVNPSGVTSSLKGIDNTNKIQIYYQFCKTNSYQGECY